MYCKRVRVDARCVTALQDEKDLTLTSVLTGRRSANVLSSSQCAASLQYLRSYCFAHEYDQYLIARASFHLPSVSYTVSFRRVVYCVIARAAEVLSSSDMYADSASFHIGCAVLASGRRSELVRFLKVIHYLAVAEDQHPEVSNNNYL